MNSMNFPMSVSIIHWMFQDIQRTQNGFEEVSYLQWRDNSGKYHNMTAGANCDQRFAHMMSDTFKLTDRALLPVTSVRYGPLR